MAISRTSLAYLASAGLFMACLAGCDDPNKRIATLQGQVTTLQARHDADAQAIKQQTSRGDELAAQVATLNRLPADRWAAVPKPASIVIDGKSGLRPGKPELSDSPTTQPAATSKPATHFVRLYLTIEDADGFAMRAGGTMRISLFDLSAAQPQSLGSYDFTPAQASRHYRTALTTDLYAFDLPLSANAPGGVTVRVEFVDYLTGKTLTAQSALK